MTQRKIVQEQEIPYLNGGAWELRKGQVIRVSGRHTVDFVAFNLHNLEERFDQARTKTNQMKIFITKGDVLYSKDNTVMMTILEDTWPWHHDLQKGTCSRKKWELAFQGSIKYAWWETGETGLQWKRWEDIPPRGCWEILTEALKPWNLSKWDIPSPINIFQNMRIDGETGQMWFDHKTPDPGEPDPYVELRADMDLLVAGANDAKVVVPFHVQIYEQ